MFSQTNDFCEDLNVPYDHKSSINSGGSHSVQLPEVELNLGVLHQSCQMKYLMNGHTARTAVYLQTPCMFTLIMRLVNAVSTIISKKLNNYRTPIAKKMSLERMRNAKSR